MKKRAIQIFLGIWLAIQAIGPLHYYCVRQDKHDERFAWRMFSPTRMMSCTPTFRVDGAAEPIGLDFHEAWLEIASRGRVVVLEAMAQRLCDKHASSDVRLDLECHLTDGSVETTSHDDLCHHPEL